VLDAVRGVALGGILWINFCNTASLYPSRSIHNLNDFTMLLEQFLGYGKFISLFSLLFGMGFALQWNRLLRLGETEALRIYSRRLWILLGLGLLHFLLIWEGDVLFVYGIVGSVLIQMRGNSGSKLLKVSLACLLFGGALFFSIFKSYDLPFPPTSSAQTWLEFVWGRLRGLWGHFETALFYLPWLVGVMLLGRWLVETGRALEPHKHLRFWRGMFAVFLPVGVVVNVWYVRHLVFADEEAYYALHALIGLPLALFYLSSLMLFYGAGKRILPLERVGRMALSNYIGQSLCFTFVLYPYGLKMLGKFSAVGALGYVLGFFALQILLSTLWLRFFKMGPLEWLWRKGTYR
jgi:uncharacterized protein